MAHLDADSSTRHFLVTFLPSPTQHFQTKYQFLPSFKLGLERDKAVAIEDSTFVESNYEMRGKKNSDTPETTAFGDTHMA